MVRSPEERNIVWHGGDVAAGHRGSLLRQRPCAIWLTGLSGSGKSTIAREVEKRLYALGHLVYVLDGDNVRHGLNADLGFSEEDRRENIRRLAELTALFVDAGLIVITAFISPFREGRALARGKVPEGRFAEVFLDVPLAECELRDPKGLYKKARTGEISGFTGIDSPYEAPDRPELVLPTAELTPTEAADRVVAWLREQDLIQE